MAMRRSVPGRTSALLGGSGRARYCSKEIALGIRLRCEDGKLGKRLFPGLGHADGTASGEGGIVFNTVKPGEDDGGTVDAIGFPVAVSEFDFAQMA